MANDLAVTTEWVRQRLKDGEALFFIELRHAGDVDLSLNKVQGALRVSGDEARRHFAEIPAGRTVVVCSSAPGDEPAYELVRQLLAAGLNAFVLSGGKKAYLSAGLPVEESGRGREMTRSRGY